MSDVIKSYLVSLSANVDKQSFDKFASAMMGAEKTVASSVATIGGSFLALEVAGVTAFASVGVGIIGYIDKLAMADAAMKRTALQSMMSIEQYRDLTQALSATGMTFQDAMMGTREDQARFQKMYEHLQELDAMLGGTKYEDQMVLVRQVRDQISLMEMEFERFGMRFVSDLLDKLGFGGGGLYLQLEKLNNFILSNMPKWSDELSTDVIPYFADLYNLLKDVVKVAGEFEVGFIHFMGELSGNEALRNSNGGFADLAKSIGIAAHEFGVLLDVMVKMETIIPPLVEMVVDMAVGMAELLSGHPLKAKEDFNRAADESVNVTRSMANIKDFLATNPFAYNPEGTNSASSINMIAGMPVDPNFMKLVQGVAQVESGNRQVDSKGNTIIGPPNPSGELAVGRMQLLPSTAKMLGVDPYNDAQNLMGGESYLAKLLLKYHGQIDPALAEYGGAKSQFSPQGQEYINKVRSAAGLTIGSVTVNVQSAPNMTPDEHVDAIRTALRLGLDDFARQQIAAFNGAYQ